MTHAPWLLGAEGDATRTTFEWGRIQSNADWILPIAASIVILLFVRYLYRKDAVELHPVLGWFLTALRAAAFLGLLVLYLQPQWRSRREEVRNSRVLLLADTSLSMGISDGPSAASGGGPTRAQQVANALKESDFLARLRKTHDVAVFQFAEGLKQDRVVSLNKLDPAAAPTDDAEAENAAPSEPGKAAQSGPDWAKLFGAHRHRDAAGPGAAAVDPRGAREARLGNCCLQRRRPKRRPVAGCGRRIGPRGEDPHLHDRPRFRSTADQRDGLRPGGASGRIRATITL